MTSVTPRLVLGMTENLVLIPGSDHPITITPTDGRVTVRLGGRVVADSTRALTLQEASYPGVQYVPLEDVDSAVLEPNDTSTYCPYKGQASYYSIRVGDDLAEAAVWTYTDPHDAVSQIKGHAAFYPDRVDAIEVDRAR